MLRRSGRGSSRRWRPARGSADRRRTRWAAAPAQSAAGPPPCPTARRRAGSRAPGSAGSAPAPAGCRVAGRAPAPSAIDARVDRMTCRRRPPAPARGAAGPPERACPSAARWPRRAGSTSRTRRRSASPARRSSGSRQTRSSICAAEGRLRRSTAWSTSGTPDEWVSTCQAVTASLPGPLNSGTTRAMGACRSSRPSSTSCITAVATIGLVTEARK